MGEGQQGQNRNQMTSGNTRADDGSDDESSSGFVGISEYHSGHLAALKCEYWNQAPSIMA